MFYVAAFSTILIPKEICLVTEIIWNTAHAPAWVVANLWAENNVYNPWTVIIVCWHNHCLFIRIQYIYIYIHIYIYIQYIHIYIE